MESNDNNQAIRDDSGNKSGNNCGNAITKESQNQTAIPPSPPLSREIREGVYPKKPETWTMKR